MGCAAVAQPVLQPWPVGGPDDTVATAAATLSGWYACADSFEDSIEIRDIKQTLIRTITRADIAALVPWMSLGGGPDGPSGLAFSDSGRLLFILVHDANTDPGGQPSDAVLRFDTATSALTVFARLELFDRDDAWPHLAMVHFKGRLYVGTDGLGGAGSVRIYDAGANVQAGALLSSGALPGGTAVHGLAVDRINNLIYSASDSTIYRASTNTLPLTWTALGSLPSVRGLAYSDNYGAAGQFGLFALSATMVPSASTVSFIPQLQLIGAQTFAPSTYTSASQEWHSIAATADGKLLVGTDEDAQILGDAADTRLSYQAWLADEFQQVVAFGRALISPGSEPPGWVLDGDVQSGTRWQPATPDGAGWVVMLLIMNDHINGDPQALPQVRSIVTRYAGLAADGIGPSKTADGIMRHWIEPQTGGVKAGRDPEFATLSTMKIVLAASRARAYWPADEIIQQAATKIICQVKNQDAYFESGTSDATYFKGLVGGGPDLSSRTTAFSEAILWAEQLGYYGGATSATKFSHWMNRSLWPTATYLTGRPITGNGNGAFQSAFTSLYSELVQPAFRAPGSGWAAQINNIRESNAAWTDDNGPKYNTVFSAGTTKPEWGGYSADSLGGHPGNISTFTSLMAMSGTGATASSVGAYNAYRRGARETFLSGASILYRRSDVDRSYTPPDAGLPDVALGALGLAELLQPGSLDAVLAVPFAPCCWANCDKSTASPALTANDFQCFLNKFSGGDPYANCDGSGTPPLLTANDFQCFLNAFAAGCP